MHVYTMGEPLCFATDLFFIVQSRYWVYSIKNAITGGGNGHGTVWR